MSAWFVERVEDHFWWTGQKLSGHSFGYDPNKALRFARKEDADMAIALLLSVPDNDNTGLHCAYVATEHVWLDQSAPPKDGEVAALSAPVPDKPDHVAIAEAYAEWRGTRPYVSSDHNSFGAGYLRGKRAAPVPAREPTLEEWDKWG